jgi:4-amino-4-deoxy-L-arabinose transferase-like glycosyltransferase
MKRALPLLPLAAVLLLAAFLRFYQLDGQSFWADEGNSIVLAQKSVGDILRGAAADIHPPLYYLLLKAWGGLFGFSERGARSLSAVMGVLMVWGMYLTGVLLKNRRVALLAAALAAVNPFLVYYSQEARMYALLALAGVFSAWAFLHWVSDATEAEGRPPWGASLFYLFFATVGLYTHYAFPIHLVTLNLVFLIWLIVTSGAPGRKVRWLAYWGALQALVVALFLPWLPIARRQLAIWPRPEVTLNGWEALVATFRLFTCGPIPCPLHLLVQMGLGAFILGLMGWGVWWQWRRKNMTWARLTLPLLWLLLPVAAMLISGAFTPAFFKFLILALPAYLFLLALSLDAVGIPRLKRPMGMSRESVNWTSLRTYVLTPLLFLVLAWPALPSLNRYYHDPTVARDDYRSIAAYIRAVAGAEDAVILVAPGQMDVFSQYDHGPAPVYPLPEDRPMDRAKTQAQLESILQSARRIYAIYWATEQADPEGFIESYLGQRAFKAWDVWVGSLRFVAYSAAPPPEVVPFEQPARFGDVILLEGAGYSRAPLQPGDIASVRLQWLATAPLATRYKVTLQLLDPANQVLAQVDSEPAGGTRPTTSWTPGEPVMDSYGLAIPLATPPGDYPLILAMYDAATGERLPVTGDGSQGDYLFLGHITIEPPDQPHPRAILGIRYPQEVVRGPFLFLGYDRYKQGFAHAPDTPLQPGDILHLTTFWQAQRPPEGDYQFEVRLDDTPLGRYHLAGPGYPTHLWQPNMPWRGEHAVLLPAELATGRDHLLSLQLLDPQGAAVGEPILLKPDLRY